MFNKKRFFLILLLILPVLGFWSCRVVARYSAHAQTISPDAIAIRVIPNMEHYSAARWYSERDFSGSPQSLTVDGYEAVRDGRTVYVNVANVFLGNLYTNIYLISYNQEAETATRDIFSQILKHWKFNTNLTVFGYCRRAAIEEDNRIFCEQDDECPAGDTCDSPKARLIRDTKRLADLAEIKIALDDYYGAGYYPVLGAGTYLPHKTLSAWPSWLDTFSGELGVSAPVDPVNELGDCPGYNEVTCWNENTKQFVADLDVPDLPDNSLVYTYSSDAVGALYRLCTVFESGLNIIGETFCSIDVCCLDFDGDGYGVPGSDACPNPETDCNDTDPDVWAGSPEICSGNIDEDCDGWVDCDDGDCAGDVACAPAPLACGDTICDSDAGEDCISCWDDCSVPCNDGICNEGCGECPLGMHSCVLDCYCGNGAMECGEECDDGNNDDNDGCSSACVIEVIVCADDDFDGYDICDIGDSGDDGRPVDCEDGDININPGEAEICDGLDNNCSDQDHSDGVNPIDIDEGWDEESCGFICLALNPSYDYNIGRAGDLRCCGDDALEDNPYQADESTPIDLCFDNNDNDCDGFVDLWDSDCSGVCNQVDEHDWINALTPGDCNQCSNIDSNPLKDGSQDDNDSQWAEDWSLYPFMVDQCDSDCGVVLQTVHLAFYENGAENTCDDIFDNDCDGQLNCDDFDCAADPACCTDDCAIGTFGCMGMNNSWACGESGDGDACLEQVITPCLPSETCNPMSGVCEPNCVDSDGDGFDAIDPANCPTGNDCDDNVAACGAYCFPGNLETCDTFDNNCGDLDHSDGVNPVDIDEGCDDDGDFYCDDAMRLYNNNSMCVNTIFTGDGMWGDDCDDNALAVNPGAVEVCDGIDNNCINGIDEGYTDENCQPLCESNGFVWSGNGDPLNCCGNDLLEDSPYQLTEFTPNCDDLNDNDCDGDVDCDDPDCATDVYCSGCRFTFTFPCVLP